MIRNLKILFAAAMALTAFGAVTAGGAQAAEEFHCSVEPCTLTASPDGTGKTAHHVFEVHNKTTTEVVSFTCNTLSGSATVETETTDDISVSSVTYNSCSVNGSPGVEVDMNGCSYTFTSTGGSADSANAHVLCPAGKAIEVTVPGGCTFSIAAQTPGNGVGYKNEGSVGSRVVTLTANVHGIVVTRSAGCESLIKATDLEGTYTTGNTIVTGETHAGLMADAWFA